MTEADYEYLSRTLSDARSRATEIAVGVRSRVGAEHRIAELGDAAIAQIEYVLREVRQIAADPSSTSQTPSFKSAAQQTARLPIRQAEETDSSDLAALLASVAQRNSQHWFPAFLNDVLAQSRSSDEITFDEVERLLQAHKQAFFEDLETARRMYRNYPHLVAAPEDGPRELARTGAE